jgi:hypothetical protein
VDGYERLRERVLAGRPDGWRLGRGLLAGKGVAGWIAACAAFTPAGVAPAGPAHRPDRPGRLVVGARPGADALVAVLAQMALAHT